jgi:hypothetical protein
MTLCHVISYKFILEPTTIERDVSINKTMIKARVFLMRVLPIVPDSAIKVTDDGISVGIIEDNRTNVIVGFGPILSGIREWFKAIPEICRLVQVTAPSHHIADGKYIISSAAGRSVFNAAGDLSYEWFSQSANQHFAAVCYGRSDCDCATRHDDIPRRFTREKRGVCSETYIGGEWKPTEYIYDGVKLTDEQYMAHASPPLWYVVMTGLKEYQEFPFDIILPSGEQIKVSSPVDVPRDTPQTFGFDPVPWAVRHNVHFAHGSPAEQQREAYYKYIIAHGKWRVSYVHACTGIQVFNGWQVPEDSRAAFIEAMQQAEPREPMRMTCPFEFAK